MGSPRPAKGGARAPYPLMTTVSTHLEAALSAPLQVSVQLTEAPENLFGVSFHLRGDGVPWRLENYQLGTVFDQAEPLMLVSEKNGALVAGLSLTRGNDAEIHDGKLITFYVQPLEDGELTFNFDYPVLSVYENGRKDVQDVQWLGGAISVDVEQEGSIPGLPVREQEQQVLGAYSSRHQAMQRIPSPEEQLLNVYLFLFGFLIVALTVSAFYLLYSRGRRIE